MKIRLGKLANRKMLGLVPISLHPVMSIKAKPTPLPQPLNFSALTSDAPHAKSIGQPFPGKPAAHVLRPSPSWTHEAFSGFSLSAPGNTQGFPLVLVSHGDGDPLFKWGLGCASLWHVEWEALVLVNRPPPLDTTEGW